MAKRPLLVTVLAILDLISGIILIPASIFLVAIMAYIGPVLAAIPGVSPWFSNVLVLGIALFLLGVYALARSYGLWRLKGWAWWLALIANIVFLIANIATSNIIGMIITGFWLWYFWSRRGHFGIKSEVPHQLSKL